MTWSPLEAPEGIKEPTPLTVRAQSIPARGYFAEHSHQWHQLVYAIQGALTVSAGHQSFVLTPQEALWLPTGTPHRVGSLLGAEFRSLWVADEVGKDLPAKPSVFVMSQLLQSLIIEAVHLQSRDEPTDGYKGRITELIFDQLVRISPLADALPWPQSDKLIGLCEALYQDPADERGPEEWGTVLNMSPRTLARRFNEELGMSMRSWRRRLRLFRSIELMGGGMGVTQVALELGYGSTSAFIYAFRNEMGLSPQAYMNEPDHRSVRVAPADE